MAAAESFDGMVTVAAIDLTRAGVENGAVKLESVSTEPIERIAQIQNYFSRRRREIQEHIRNP